MKYCPKCQSTYTDETLQFCLQDGTQLVVNNQTESPTVSFEGDETVISSRKPAPIQFDLNDSNETNWEQSQQTRTSTFEPEKKGSNTLLVVLTTVVVMFLLFGFVGVGAWFYFNQKTGPIADISGANSNQSNTNQRGEENINKEPVSTPTSKSTPKKTPTPKPTPDQNPEETKKDISSRINNWKSLAEARNLEGYMNNYASRIDYYNKRNASKGFVRNDKKKAFEKYTSIKVQLSNISINPSTDGQTAVAAFDKEWDFTGAENDTSGKVRQQLRLKKNGEVWEITAEKDLKVYYVNK
jgi:hypothetical protein